MHARALVLRLRLLLLGAVAACSTTVPADRPAPTVHLGGRIGTASPVTTVQAGWAPADAGVTTAGFGHDPHEPVGPWAVFADGEGVSVLDQVRSRIVRYDLDGRELGVVPIPAAATWDAVSLPDPDGGPAGYGLLTWTPGEADPHWSVQTIDAAGTLTGENRVALDPPTAVLVDRGRLLVEDRHAETVDVTTGERYPGRPTGDGRYVHAHKDDLRHLTLTWSDVDGGDQRAVVLATDRPLVDVVGLEARGDEAMVGLFFMEATTDPALAHPELRVVRVDRSGRLRQESRLEAGTGHDPNRPLAFLSDGSVVHLQVDESGVRVGRMAP